MAELNSKSAKPRSDKLGRLYWIASYSKPKSQLHEKRFYFNVDEEFKYYPFFSDFGPLTLSNIYVYCTEMKALLANPKYENCLLFHHTSRDTIRRTNSALLMGCYEILSLDRSAEEVKERWKDVKFRHYIDASHIKSTYKCYVSPIESMFN